MATNRRNIYVICVAFAILLGSLFGITTDLNFNYNEEILIYQYYHEPPIVNLNEFITAGNIQQSTIQAVLEGQVKSYKKNVDFEWNSIFINTKVPTLFQIFLIFLSLCYVVINSSHRFIIQYIHNIDGQK